ncbi:MAG: phosphatase PAP2 family protein [Miltoncostaeaceae bacterium]
MAGPSRRPLLLRLARADRRAGRAVRDAARGRPGPARALSASARLLSPAFRTATAVLVALPATRGTGVRALVAAGAAATLARVLRDALGRRRPGIRAEAGFPSRHAAAAVAIAATVAADRRALGATLGASAAVGMAGRVVTGDHDPADLVAGAVLGAAVAALMTRVGRGR